MTNKLQHIIIALLFTLSIASCSDDNTLSSSEELLQATFTTQIPYEIIMRADSEIQPNKVMCGVIRNGQELQQLRSVKELVMGKATFEMSFVKGFSYSVVFWAYYCDNDTDGYYDTTDLNAIKIRLDNGNIAVDGNSAKRDAFFATHTFDTNNNNITEKIELKRAMAQICVATTNTADVAKTATTIKNTFTSFNPLTGELSEPKDILFSSTIIPNENDIIEGGKSYKPIAIEYVFAKEEETKIDIAIDIQNEEGVTLRNKTFTSVPIKKNTKVKLMGNI